MSDEANPSLASTTPSSKVTPQRDNQETPLNASSTNIGAGSDTTPRSLYDSIGAVTRRKLSLTPSGNNEDIVGATAESPLSVRGHRHWKSLTVDCLHDKFFPNFLKSICFGDDFFGQFRGRFFSR